MLGLRYFVMLCNNAEYKRIGQDQSLGQVYDVHNKIKISTKHWLGLLICYDNNELNWCTNMQCALFPATFTD